MKALIILIMFIVAIYLIGVNFVIWHEHQHQDAFTKCGVASTITYSNFGLAGYTQSDAIYDDAVHACADLSVDQLDNFDKRLTTLEKNVNDYLGRHIAAKDLNDFTERYNNTTILVPNAGVRLAKLTGGTYYNDISYISMYVYHQPSSVACKIAMHEVGHHRWYTELTEAEKNAWNNDTEAYPTWFASQFDCNTNKVM